MKKTTILALLLAAVMLFGACGTLTEIDKIDTEAAKAIALKALSLTGEEVSYAEAVLNERDGRKYYDVKITVDGIEYMFAVDATSGVIIEQSENVALLMKEEVESVQSEEVEPVEVIPPPIGTDTVIELTPAEVDYPKIDTVKQESAGRVIRASDMSAAITAHSGYSQADIRVLAQIILPVDTKPAYQVYFTTPDGKYHYYAISRETCQVVRWETSDELNDLSYPLRNSATEIVMPEGMISIEEAFGYALSINRWYDSKMDTIQTVCKDDVILYVAEPDLYNGEYEYDLIYQEKSTGWFVSVTVRASDGAIRHFARGRWEKGYFGKEFTDVPAVKMSESQAKNTVRSYVPGSTLSDITAFTTNTEDGKMEYVGTLTYGGMHYTFTIDAYSGAFRSWEATPAK